MNKKELIEYYNKKYEALEDWYGATYSLFEINYEDDPEELDAAIYDLDGEYYNTLNEIVEEAYKAGLTEKDVDRIIGVASR